MARKKDIPQKAIMREFMQSYLKENDVKIKDGSHRVLCTVEEAQ